MTNETCANCGHEKEEHYFIDGGCMAGTHKDDDRELCLCMKFKPQKTTADLFLDAEKTLQKLNPQKSVKDLLDKAGLIADKETMTFKPQSPDEPATDRSPPISVKTVERRRDTQSQDNRRKLMKQKPKMNARVPDTLRGIFDTTDLDEEINDMTKEIKGFEGKIEIEIKDGGFFIDKNKNIFVKNCFIDKKRATLKERQRIKAKVEKVIDEKIVEFRKNPSIASNMVLHLEELKKRLGI